MKKLLMSVMAAAILAACLFPAAAGCNKGDRLIDKTKTQLYVSNYDGGFGTQWLRDAAKDFEQLYKDESLGWDLQLVIQSTQLHDIGKIAIRDCILLKPGKLSEDEYEVIKKHTVYGEDVIMEIENKTSEHEFLEYAKIFTATHHEKWDGSGYPRGLKGEEIPLLGRLMAIVDVYDALVAVRPYKAGFPHEEAVSIIADSSGIHFDPAIVDLFLSVSDQFSQIAAQ